MEQKYKHLLEVKDLYTSFNIPAGEVRSVNGVSFNVDKGKVLGIVGESGSGKSVTAYSIMQILQHPGRIVSGSIRFKGKELIGLPANQLQKIRGEKISIIFQDPMSSLNPVYTIGNQIKEAINLHPVPRIINALDKKINDAKKAYEDAKNSNKDAKEVEQLKENYRHAQYEKDNYAQLRAIEMLKLVGINEPEKRLKQYPFEFSGGMLQRIMIAMSLVCEPDLLIADEPTTALDVTIQAQILELLKDLQQKMDMGIIIITHDLGVVAQVCDEVDVMYAGRIVERGTVEEIFYNPQHEYTKGLMQSIPQANDTRERLVPIEGNPVDVFRLPKGCSFAPRCQSCMRICLQKYPRYMTVNDKHETACFKYYLEAYKNHKIDKKTFLEFIQESTTGNASFKPLTHYDVLDAYNDYQLADRMYRHVAQKVASFTQEEREVIYYTVKERKANWKRAQSDYKMSVKTKKI
ncbi:MAG: ABC transporter ATP-binding protein, partial [Bacilli bacterium]|nr:ABC transporter ATP-binding protein [Bacilli bacterium]